MVKVSEPRIKEFEQTCAKKCHPITKLLFSPCKEDPFEKRHSLRRGFLSPNHAACPVNV